MFTLEQRRMQRLVARRERARVVRVDSCKLLVAYRIADRLCHE